MASKYQLRKKGFVLLEDGTIFYGKVAGKVDGKSFGEICFNTAMTGHQEIMTNPNYFGQILVATNPHIGNGGIFSGDNESTSPQIKGLVCRNFSYYYARVAAEESLEDYLEKHDIMALSDVDTRALTTYIRDHGAMNAVIASNEYNVEELGEELQNLPRMKGQNLAQELSTKEPYFYGNEKGKHKVAVIDCGVKNGILESLVQCDCYLQVFPYDAAFDTMNQWKPDAYLISNGPGDPAEMKTTIQTVKDILSADMPLFGIGLGHQIIALANDISTFKLHHGFHGLNQPVINLNTGKGEITAQHNGFAVNMEELDTHTGVELSHLNLNHQSVAGLKLKNKKCFSVQYHPEAFPGPKDSGYLFDEFVEMMH